MNPKDINDEINKFRRIIALNAITPDSLGVLLQMIADEANHSSLAHVVENTQLINVNELTYNSDNPFGSLRQALDALATYCDAQQEHAVNIGPGTVITFSLKAGDAPERWVWYQLMQNYYSEYYEDWRNPNNWREITPAGTGIGRFFMFDNAVWSNGSVELEADSVSEPGDLTVLEWDDGMYDVLKTGVGGAYDWITLPATDAEIAIKNIGTEGWEYDPRIMHKNERWQLVPDALFFASRRTDYIGPNDNRPVEYGMFFKTDSKGELSGSESWGMGKELARLRSQMPKVQSTRNGDAQHYVYSVDDPDSKMAVLNAPDTFVTQRNGHLMMQKGIWNPEGASIFYSRNNIPGASASADGVMTKEVFSRLGTLGRIYQQTASSQGVIISYPNWSEGGARTFTIGCATSGGAGVMSIHDKVKLDALPEAEAGKGWSTFDFNREWLTKLSNAGVYGTQTNMRRAVNGVFALAAGATDEQIRAALTEYSTKAELTRDDLEYCAANGCGLRDEQTQGLVHVIDNGGGFFSLIELSMANYGELPRLRFVGLRALDDGMWTVTRPGQQERICYKSEFDTLAARVAVLEQKGGES